ncbi:MAG: hypothetical protein MHM6MM_006996 [Cercozoa sp. M6MM]
MVCLVSNAYCCSEQDSSPVVEQAEAASSHSFASAVQTYWSRRASLRLAHSVVRVLSAPLLLTGSPACDDESKRVPRPFRLTLH